MHVVVNAQLDPEQAGGIAQVLAGLADGMGRWSGDDVFTFVCSPKSAEWLAPRLRGPSRSHVNAKASPGPRRGVRTSDGFWEALRPDVLHFPYQAYTRTGVPTVFNPHDLQHAHFPEFFDDEERERRESLMRDACRLADVIATASDWVRRDVIGHFGIEEQKVRVVPWGAPTALRPRPSPDDVERVLRQFRLSRGFALYPAQTWAHKNHLRLLEALAILRDDTGLRIPLVCTGSATEHAGAIHARVHALRLGDQARWLGRVGDAELVALYRAARMVVVPSLFEAASFPILEAFDQGTPVACSRVTSLPEQVGDAALLFDPEDAFDIARALKALWRDAALRTTLSTRGRRRAEEMSWDATARGYVELYRLAIERRHRFQDDRVTKEGKTPGADAALEKCEVSG